MRTFFRGAAVVTGEALTAEVTLVVDGDAVVDIASAVVGRGGPTDADVELGGCFIVPGFVDLHVHGVLGVDVLDGAGAVERVARALPRWGVTAFSPTSLACPPEVLATMLEGVGACRTARDPLAARVLGAHLESNFINPQYAGAQPVDCLCTTAGRTADFTGADVLRVIRQHARHIGVVTLAPELPGGLELARELIGMGVQVSIGHSGADYAEAVAAFDAGVTRATHLFSAMPPLLHREPGSVGAVLRDARVSAEIICDGVHLHEATIAIVLAAKGRGGAIAITDGTAASGLERGARTHIGPRPVTALDAARLDNGALAGSTATMDRVFRYLVQECGQDIVAAARLTSTNAARHVGLARAGVIEPGARADFAVLNPDLTVRETWVAGRRVWPT